MKKLLLSVAAVGIALYGSAQFTFSDDFESYTVGNYLGLESPNWTTWNGTPGGSDDVTVTNTDAHSGSKSVYFQSTLTTGGPADVVLPFGAAHTTDNFVFEMWMKVESNKGAYFNFQSDVTVAQTWALECQFRNDNSFRVVSDMDTVMTGTYSSDTWFKVTWDIELDSNVWEFLIDGVSQGSFSNTNNRIASLDLFPVNAAPEGNNIAGFWVDDVSYELITPPSRVEEVAEQSFSISPNPASDFVVLNLVTEVQPQITITDMMGRITYETQPTFMGAAVRIPVSALAGGVYLVNVRTGNELSVQKLVVE